MDSGQCLNLHGKEPGGGTIVLIDNIVEHLSGKIVVLLTLDQEKVKLPI